MHYIEFFCFFIPQLSEIDDDGMLVVTMVGVLWQWH